MKNRIIKGEAPENYKGSAMTMKPIQDILIFLLETMYSYYVASCESFNKNIEDHAAEDINFCDKQIDILKFPEWLADNNLLEKVNGKHIITLDEAILQEEQRRNNINNQNLQ